MAKLNIYLPDDIHKLASRWRKTVNLSEICARALREELSAADSSRSMVSLYEMTHTRSEKEKRLMEKFKLAECIVVDAAEGTSLRNELGIAAANYVDRWICDGSVLAIAGGRQTWNVVRNLKPRNVRVDIAALGFGQLDPIALHTHSNTLLTLSWLLYAPRAAAHLVGSSKLDELLNPTAAVEGTPRYFLLASCAPFSEDSPLAALLGPGETRRLRTAGAVADFAYVFLDKNGDPINAKLDVCPVPRSVPSVPALQQLSRRADARTMLVAGGKEKAEIAQSVLTNNLCNSIVVDSELADVLLIPGKASGYADRYSKHNSIHEAG